MIDVIIRNAKRLKDLQEDILDVTKIEGHMLELDKKQFSLNKVIMEVMEDLKHNISEPISLVFNPQEDQIVLADRSRLAQVISNLVANAIRFTHEGTVEIDIDKDPIRKFVVIKIRDTGSGIDQDILPRLFTKFATKTGTGLGLYISKSIVEAHSGSIWAENNDNGKGATFFVGLPM
jgi:signal transduction histidine kinase